MDQFWLKEETQQDSKVTEVQCKHENKIIINGMIEDYEKCLDCKLEMLPNIKKW